MKMKKWLLILCVGLAFSACQTDDKNNGIKDKENTVNLPAFDIDSAYAFVKKQTDFGPRVPNTQAHDDCATYLLKTMQQYCDVAISQSFNAKTYDGKIMKGQNIIASFLPEKEERILLGAHWDSRHIADYDPNPDNRNTPVDGANDGASGVGVLMEVARQLQIKNPEIGVDIIFFDVEDYGTPNSEDIPGDWWCLGSQYWSKNKHIANYTAKYGILLDMVGAANATFYHEGFSYHFAPRVVSKVWGVANRLGFGSYFINESANPITDDHYYVNMLGKIQMINIIHQDKKSNTGFYPYWHTANDNIDKIDKNTLGVVGKTILALIYEE